MKWTGLNELRESYLNFFESKGHLRLPSFPLIPQNDNSLLLINSGMAPMKKYFTGEIIPPRNRVTTCQKCIRTPDIERVGKTARHGTYFEMLGNFSFGDYFKREATAWAWEYFTKVLEIPADRLWVTIYLDDDESFDIWTKEVGVSPDRIVRLGKEDNFWEHGPGPCGPCSEIHFDRGEKFSCGKPSCAVGCDCDRYVEVWNLVFTQFESDGNDNYTLLDHPNIDTGMGLERLACVMQGVDNLFEVDTVAHIMDQIAHIAGVKYKENEKVDVSLRVITDHVRSTTIMIGDGVMPSNEGRGYVLRRLLRRAARHGRLLGINEPFLYKVAKTVIEENRSAYPELCDKTDFITKLIKVEEENFSRTIDQGLQLLSDLMQTSKNNIISGDDAFRLYDTYGFPLDLTKDILEEKEMTVDEDRFTELMTEQRKRARDARKNAGTDAWEGEKNLFEGISATTFVGYNTIVCDSEILCIASQGEKTAILKSGESAVIAIDETPFYAEGGGQTGDIGYLKNGESVFKVTNTTINHDGVYLHTGVVEKGEFKLSDKVVAEVCADTRNATKRNHTSAHLLQAALINVLGNHIQQAGQLVNADRMRFDFTHFSALTHDEIEKVENEVNRAILSGVDVCVEEMPIAKAREMGAMALFGEKYGDVVRVVKCGDYSIELCGGTHVSNTSNIGLFKIVSESSVAAGIRRIEAITGIKVLDMINEQKAAFQNIAAALKSGTAVKDIIDKAKNLTFELKEKDSIIESLRNEKASGQLDELFKNAVDVNGALVVTGVLNVDGGDALRSACDKAKEYKENIVAVFAGINKEKGAVTLASACGKQAIQKGAHAGNIVREVASMLGGKGGGRPDIAMAGGKDIDGVQKAFDAVVGIVKNMVK